MTNRIKVGYVVSHPIQYQVPLFRILQGSDRIDLEVLFLSRHGVEESYDPGFQKTIRLDGSLLDGYRHRFLGNVSPRPSIEHPFGLINPSALRVGSGNAYDAVIVHGYEHLSKWLLFMGAGLGRTPYLLRGESRLATEARLGPQKLRFKRTLVGRLVRGAAACLAIGWLNKEFYAAYGVPKDRIFWAPYGVDNDRFAASGKRGRDEREDRLEGLGLDPAWPTVLFASKLQPWKRPLDVVAAVDRMERNVNLLFVGDGPLRTEVEDGLARLPRARSLGFVDQEEIGHWYGVADVFVLPSASEPWGLAVNEAMAAGAVPVVSDAVGCGPDLVAPDTGRVFPAGDVAALARTLDEVVSPEFPLDATRAAAAARVERYSLRVTAEGMEEAAVASARATR